MPEPVATEKVESDFFRVAVSGATIDGRVIKPEWLEQAAQHYDPDYYTASIFVEHIRGFEPQGAFKAQGKVLELKTQVDTLKGKDKLCLYARIEAYPTLVEMVGKSQKLFTSIEIEEPFADLGAAYMPALAVTDTPASLGTQALKFAADNTRRYFSETLEASLPLKVSTKNLESTFMAEVRAFMREFKKMFGKTETTLQTELSTEPPTDPSTDPQNNPGETHMDQETKAALDALSARLQTLETSVTEMPQDVASKVTEDVKAEVKAEVKTEIKDEIKEEVVQAATGEVKEAVQEEYKKLESEIKKAHAQFAVLSKTDADPNKRPLTTGGSTGGRGYALADC